VKGESLTLVRNESYWKTDPETGRQLPYLDTLVVRFYPDAETLLQAFRDREVQVITPPVESPEDIEILRELEAEGAVLDVVPGPIWEQLAFQFGRTAWPAMPARMPRT